MGARVYNLRNAKDVAASLSDSEEEHFPRTVAMEVYLEYLLIKIGKNERKIETTQIELREDIEDAENRMLAETTNQVKSLRKVQEVRFQVVEGKLEDFREGTTKHNKRLAELIQLAVRKNKDEIQKVEDRRQQLEDKI
ncbi:uncharacterized protein LOC117178624 [Belonocnema kinseyi]|uniref:uncharacterized protein LOC117178624 n=1 Tax=Belonocnema kinseyi TaxID=2817044 RepID=UPI00143D96BB|nr:uncharacterized protein LOC117178624 [Belonocnema kinseyi]